MLLYDLENRRIVCVNYIDWEKDVQPVYEKEVADNHERVRGYVPKPHEIDCMLREICNNHDKDNIDAIIHKIVVDFIRSRENYGSIMVAGSLPAEGSH